MPGQRGMLRWLQLRRESGVCASHGLCERAGGAVQLAPGTCGLGTAAINDCDCGGSFLVLTINKTSVC